MVPKRWAGDIPEGLSVAVDVIPTHRQGVLACDLFCLLLSSRDVASHVFDVKV